MLPELVDDGRRVLLFSQFTEMLDADRAPSSSAPASPCRAAPATRRTAPARRWRAFQARAVPVFLMSLKAGGVGLNLTAADTVIHLRPVVEPGRRARRPCDRAHRIGQDKPVFVYKLIVEGSIEDRMLALQERKRALAEGVLGPALRRARGLR